MSAAAARPFRWAAEHPLALAALGTTLALCLLQLTEEFDPPGSSFGWLIFIALAAAHRPLLSPPRAADPRPPATLSRIASLAVVLAASGWLLWSAAGRLFDSGVVPRDMAQLGLATQVAARIGGTIPLYREEYPRVGFEATNSFPPGAAIPFALARAYRWDWRAANIAGAGLFAALLAAAAATAGSRRGALALAAGAAWLALPRSLDYLGWGHAPPLWPLLFGLGASLASGSALMAALLAGLLAACSAGWLLLAPLVLAAFWRSHRGRAGLLIAALIVPPLFAYGLARLEFHDVLKGILGGPFGEGRGQRATSWRFATAHGLGDFFGLRIAVYAAGLATMAMLATRLRDADDAARPRLFAAAAFVAVAFGPVAHFFHWMAHAALLAGLVAGADAEPRATRAFVPRLALAAATAAIFLSFLPMRADSRARALDVGSGRQRHDSFMLEGWNIESADHVWGREKYLATGFVLSKPAAGVLELRFETLGGEFTPINPVVIRVNGRAKAVYRELPGRGSLALVPLQAEDLSAGFNTVELECGWSRTPMSYRVSSDTRRVSVMYRGLRFLPSG